MSYPIPVPVKLVTHGSVEDIDMLPAYAHKGDAGCDARANIPEPIILKPGERVLIPTGLYTAIPENYEIQVRPRSGLALKKGVTVLNTPGCIDENFRGQIGVILINHGSDLFDICPGDRIAQLILSRVEKIEWSVVSELPDTDRGETGFGDSGVK